MKLKGCRKKCIWDSPSFKSSNYGTLGKVHIHIGQKKTIIESWKSQYFLEEGEWKGEEEYLSSQF